jgi:hypothetical protein
MRPLECMPAQLLRVEATIDTAGGTLPVGAHRLEIPPNAVAGPVTFTGTQLPGNRVRLDLRANGTETHKFAQPASLTLSFAQCTPPGQADVQRVRIFRERGNGHDQVGGQVDVNARTVTTPLESLSVYTLGLP